jgi:hypothetical protein
MFGAEVIVIGGLCLTHLASFPLLAAKPTRAG